MREITRKNARKSSKIVRQRGERKNSGIAATAALAGVSYAVAEAALPPPTAVRGANAIEIRRACMGLTGKRFRLRTYSAKPLVHEAGFPKAPVVAALLRTYPDNPKILYNSPDSRQNGIPQRVNRIGSKGLVPAVDLRSMGLTQKRSGVRSIGSRNVDHVQGSGAKRVKGNRRRRGR